MKPSPIINVANAAPTGTAKPASGSSSDQSFGQVLAQQVNAPSSSSAANSHAQNAAPSNTSGNAQSSNSAPGNAGANTSGSSAATGGKNVKSKHGQDDSSNSSNGTATQTPTDPNAANGSAQLLALVSNVQQTVTSNASTATGSVDSALGAIDANTASTAQAALANFQAAVATGTSSAGTAVQAAPDFSQEIKAALPGVQSDTQDITADSTTQDPASAFADNAKTVSSLTAGTQSTASTQSMADLAATAQKDVQADIASLAQAAAKSADAIRDTVASAAAAAPAIVNTAQLNTVASQMSGTDDTLAPQVGSTDWNQSLGQKVVWMVAGGQQSASLTLNPPDLGPMQVVLNVTNSHATATFTAAQPEVRQALENALPKLREMLGDAGIQLGQASVNAGTAQQQQNFANQSSQRSGNGGSDRGIDAIDGSQAIAAQTATRVTSGIGLVDTFA